jgi:predicted Zn finger-like uncharacterized protein
MMLLCAGRSMLKSRMSGYKTADKPFIECPNCKVRYHVVKVKVGAAAVDRPVTCRGCDGPLPGRDGSFVMKYYPLRKPKRTG